MALWQLHVLRLTVQSTLQDNKQKQLESEKLLTRSHKVNRGNEPPVEKIK